MKVIGDKKDGSSPAAGKWVESPCASCCQGEPGEIEYEYQDEIIPLAVVKENQVHTNVVDCPTQLFGRELRCPEISL